jgi:hypothetical protein
MALADLDLYEKPRFTINTLEDWRAYVAWDPPVRPERLTHDELRALSRARRSAYNKARGQWHANLPFVDHKAVHRVFALIDGLLQSNQRWEPSARGGLVLDGPAGAGKSSLQVRYGKRLERHLRDRYRGRPPVRPLDEWVPVVYIKLGADTWWEEFLRAICAFFGLETKLRKHDLARFVERLLIACGTVLLLVDDIDRMVNTPQRGLQLNALLKALITNVPATHVYAGIRTEENAGLGTGEALTSGVHAQTRKRFQFEPLGDFKRPIGVDRKDQEPWNALLKAFEPAMVLATAEPRMLRDLGPYLHDRTGGNLRSLTTLLERGCDRAIRNGRERLAQEDLDEIEVDKDGELQSLASGRQSIYERRGVLEPEEREALARLSRRRTKRTARKS